MTTQVLKARRGIVTEEMEVVAEMEGKPRNMSESGWPTAD